MPSPTKIGPFPYFPLEFTKDGAINKADQLAALVDALTKPTGNQVVTDLLVLSHGWNDDMAEAEALYTTIGDHIAAVLPKQSPACADDSRPARRRLRDSLAVEEVRRQVADSGRCGVDGRQRRGRRHGGHRPARVVRRHAGLEEGAGAREVAHPVARRLARSTRRVRADRPRLHAAQRERRGAGRRRRLLHVGRRRVAAPVEPSGARRSRPTRAALPASATGSARPSTALAASRIW